MWVKIFPLQTVITTIYSFMVITTIYSFVAIALLKRIMLEIQTILQIFLQTVDMVNDY